MEAIIVASVLQDIAEGLGVAYGLVNDLAVEHALVMAVHGDIVGKCAVGIETGDCLSTLLVVAAAVREGDIPGAVTGTRDDGGCGSSGHGNYGSNGKTHVDDVRGVGVS